MRILIAQLLLLFVIIPFESTFGETFSEKIKSAINTEGNVNYASARRLHIKGNLLPDASFYVPNSFPNSGADTFYGFLNGISRVRTRSAKSGCEPRCSDAIAYLEADLWKNRRQSFSLQYSVHSLSSRNSGTSIGEGQSLGFKYARSVGSNGALSFSGEHVFQFDDTVDLGRNLFLGYSLFLERKLLGFSGLGYALNMGLGTGLYTVQDNNLFRSGRIFGGNNIAGDADVLTWGPIGSVSYFFSNRVSVGAEFIGFGFGAGASVKPFKSMPLTVTGYLYDLIDDFPEGIPCAESPCQPRLYGRLSYSF